ncbi:unnamed protein product, partial [Discosporangium mesarthrocarpum]
PTYLQNFQRGFAPRESWSWDALALKFGDSTVRVSLSDTGRFDGPEDGSLWGLPGEEVLVRPPGTSMTFDTFVSLLRGADRGDGDGKGQRQLNETFYLEYLAVHQYLGKPMQVRLGG